MYEQMTNEQLSDALERVAARGGSIRPIILEAEKRKLKLRVQVRNAATGWDPDKRHQATPDDDQDSPQA